MQRGDAGRATRWRLGCALGYLTGCAAPAVNDGMPGEPDDLDGRPAAIGTWTTDPSPQSMAVLRKSAAYARWPVFPEHQEHAVRSRGHDDAWVVAHYNTAASEAVLREDAELPDGSIIVKENRPEPEAPATVLTTMAKVGGRWHWMKHTPGGEIVVEDGLAVEGQVAHCIGCHADAPRDMVFGGVWP